MTTSIISRLGRAPEEGIKAPVVVETNAPITLVGTQTINSVAVNINDRVAVKDQVDASQNAIYVVKNGAWERAKDFNRSDDVCQGMLVVSAETKLVYMITFTGTYNPGVTDITFEIPNLFGQVETNDLTQAVTWANIPNTNVPLSAVSQHEFSLFILASQILGVLADGSIGQSGVTQHQAALNITESQISDLSHTTDAGALTSGVLADARVQESNITQHAAAIANILHPVGSLHFTNNSTNPGDPSVFGVGTWIQVEGRFIVGVGDNGDGKSYTLNETGGSKDAVVVDHTHSITDPGHRHQMDGGLDGNGSGGFDDSNDSFNVNTTLNTTGITIDNAGVSGTDQNLVPYRAKYVWERTV